MHMPSRSPTATAVFVALMAVPGLSAPFSTVCNSSSSLTQSYYPPAADCVEYTIPVTITSDNIQFTFPEWDDDYDLEDFLTLATTRASANLPSVAGESKNETGTYNIAVSFCSPKNAGDKAKTVILATHGIGQPRSHWNSPYKPEDYNFVQHAIDQGYSVFFYDRLGQGFSQRVSGYTNQLQMHAAILKQLTDIVKSGDYTRSIGKPSKLAVMGFSFGSYITHAAIGSDPSIADAVILTAIGLDIKNINANGLVRSFVPRIANQQDGEKFGDFDNGYLTWVDTFSQVNTYFKRPFFDVATTDFAESAKQPFGIAEFITFPLGGNNGTFDASGFTGPALTITGKNDYIVCDGECEGIEVEPASTYYKNAKPFVPYLHPDASHNINFHHNATGAYKVITSFLDENLK